MQNDFAVRMIDYIFLYIFSEDQYTYNKTKVTFNKFYRRYKKNLKQWKIKQHFSDFLLEIFRKAQVTLLVYERFALTAFRSLLIIKSACDGFDLCTSNRITIRRGSPQKYMFQSVSFKIESPKLSPAT